MLPALAIGVHVHWTMLPPTSVELAPLRTTGAP